MHFSDVRQFALTFWNEDALQSLSINDFEWLVFNSSNFQKKWFLQFFKTFDFIRNFDCLIDKCRKRADPEVPNKGVVHAYFEIVGKQWTLVGCLTQGRYVGSTNAYSARSLQHDNESNVDLNRACLAWEFLKKTLAFLEQEFLQAHPLRH